MSYEIEKNILLYTEEPSINIILTRFFSKKDYLICEAKSDYEFKEKIKDNFHTIIIEEKELKNNTQFVNDLLTYFNGLFILISNENYIISNKITRLKKPLNLKELDSIISDYYRNKNDKKNNYIYKFISENLSKNNSKILFSILQLNEKNIALIYTENKKIVHAEYNDLIGEEAWEELIKIPDGLLAFYNDIETPLITCDIEIEVLINNTIKKTLIISSNNTLSSIIKKLLEIRNIECFIIQNKFDFDGQKNIKFEFIIIDDTFDDSIIKNIENYQTSCFIILGRKNISLKHPEIKLFDKPLVIRDLEIFIDSKLNNTKDVKNFNNSLKEYISNKIDKEEEIKHSYIHIKNESGYGYIYISNNNFIHAEFNDLIGEEAFNKIISLDKFELENKTWKDPIIKTINIPISYIVPEIITSKKELQKKILILDDDVTTLKILSKIFTKNNFKVIESNSTEDAMDILNKENFSFVISDINIPNKNGLKFLLWIKQNFPETKVIMISSFSSEKIINFAYEHGALKFFEKPIEIDKLINFVENIETYININNTENSIFIELLKKHIDTSIKTVIGVFDPISNNKGIIILENNNIIYTQYGQIKGIDALFEIFKIKNIFYKLLDKSISLEPNIDQNFIEILEKYSKKNEIQEKEISTKDDLKDKKQIKILIVDDDNSSVKILSRFLTLRGFYTKTSESAVEGEKILFKEKFDLVITDLNMPEVNGLEFLLWIKQYFPETKVIIMTAFNSDKLKIYSNKEGAFYYFEKPINLKELEKLINTSFDENIIYKDLRFEDFIKVALLINKDRIISITDIDKNEISYIYIKDKNVVHAESGSLKGIEALKAIFNKKNGIFSDIPWENPIELTLNYSIENLFEHFLNNSFLEEKTTTKNIIEDKEDYLILLSNNIKNESNTLKKLTIYEEGVALEIILGKTKKEEAIEIMKKYSSENFLSTIESQVLIYQDLSLTILFDEDSKVNELRFGSLYKGLTNKGIRIGDELKKGFEVYGKPDIFTLKGAIWNKIALFSSDEKYITSIRIRNN